MFTHTEIPNSDPAARSPSPFQELRRSRSASAQTISSSGSRGKCSRSTHHPAPANSSLPRWAALAPVSPPLRGARRAAFAAQNGGKRSALLTWCAKKEAQRVARLAAGQATVKLIPRPGAPSVIAATSPRQEDGPSAGASGAPAGGAQGGRKKRPWRPRRPSARRRWSEAQRAARAVVADGEPAAPAGETAVPPAPPSGGGPPPAPAAAWIPWTRGDVDPAAGVAAPPWPKGKGKNPGKGGKQQKEGKGKCKEKKAM